MRRLVVAAFFAGAIGLAVALPTGRSNLPTPGTRGPAGPTGPRGTCDPIDGGVSFLCGNGLSCTMDGGLAGYISLSAIPTCNDAGYRLGWSGSAFVCLQ
ncbi:MAG: hypothetical protein WC876_01810 [Candidatus Thermoplasmatota archaeon]|jgi:hypothetical protein